MNSEYCVIKLILLEKRVPFEEVVVFSQAELDGLSNSHFGRIPLLETPEGYLCRFEAMQEYLEERYPEPTFCPEGAYMRAHVRQVQSVIAEYFSSVTQPLYRETIFNERLSTAEKAEILPKVQSAIAILGGENIRGPYLFGDQLTYADLTAAINFPLALSAVQQVFKTNILKENPRVQRYIDHLGSNENIAAIWMDGARALIQASSDNRATSVYFGE